MFCAVRIYLINDVMDFKSFFHYIFCTPWYRQKPGVANTTLKAMSRDS